MKVVIQNANPMYDGWDFFNFCFKVTGRVTDSSKRPTDEEFDKLNAPFFVKLHGKRG